MKNIFLLSILMLFCTGSTLFSGDRKVDLQRIERELTITTPIPDLRGKEITSNNREGRVLWLTRFEYSTPVEIRNLIDLAAEANFNIILFQVRGQADAFYFSSYEPWSENLGGHYPGFDPLQVAIDEAHSLGLELHAYINVFPMWTGNSPPSSPIHIYNTHPEWVMVDFYGNPMDPADPGYAFGSPGILAFQDHLYNVAMDIIENYNVDGLHLDYIRYPGNTYSYDDESVTRFQEETGLDAYSHSTEYSDWRRAQVETVVRRIYQGIKDRKPQLALSAAVWGNYYSGRNFYFQDSHHWCQQNIIDFLCPMIYTEDNSTYASYVANHVNDSYGKFIYAGIGTYMHSSFQTTLDQIEIARNYGAEGVTLFSASDLTPSRVESLLNGPFSQKVEPPIMNWKDYVFIEHNPHPDDEDTSNAYTINALITSNVSLIPDSVFLIYRYENQPWDTTTMTSSDGELFTGEIPPHGYTSITYYLEARNDSGYYASSPRWAPIHTYQFNVLIDTIPPEISEISVSSSFLMNTNPVIHFKISDNLGLDTSSVLFHYALNNGPFQSATPETSEDRFYFQIPGYLNPGDSITYYIEARDIAQSRNYVSTLPATFHLAHDGFEAGADNWIVGPNWEVQNELVHNGTKAMRIRPGDTNPFNPFIISRDLLNPDNFAGLSLSFYSYQDFQPGDSCFVELSNDGGATWETFLILTESNLAWQKHRVNIPDTFLHNASIGIRLRFRFLWQQTQDQYQGWVIDDVQLYAENISPLQEPDQNPPEHFQIYSNYPNPFNSTTRIKIVSPQAMPLTLQILTLQGRLIYQKCLPLKPGTNYFSINFNNLNIPPAASGIYLLRLSSSHYSRTIKLILLK